MSTTRSNKYQHNKGQMDRKHGKSYSSPSSMLDYLNPSSSGLRKSDSLASSYRKGWNSQKSDKK